MGCTSSTEIHTDPHTGKETKKKRLGGAYPGRRPPQHQPYAPPEGAFAGGNTATAHFVSHGGGNALTLANPDGTPIPPASGGAQKEFIQVTLPDGVKAGDTIHVQAPSGKTNAIVIPAGFGPGDSFTVEFADETQGPPASNTENNYGGSAKTNNNTPAPTTTTSSSNLPDDGFATGFGNPHWRPTATAVHEPEVHATTTTAQDDQQHYPSATATPVYVPQFSPPPSYPSK